MRRVRWMLVGGLTAGLVVGAVAEPLPKEYCDKLLTEQADLEKAGLKDAYLKGPAWAKANLGADQLKRVERFIAVEELLSFRCGLAKARLTLPFADEDHPPSPPEESKDDDSPSAAKPKPKPKAKAEPPAKAPRAAPKSVSSPESPAKQPVAAQAPAKPKPKVDDAYRPPKPANPEADPFVTQKK